MTRTLKGDIVQNRTLTKTAVYTIILKEEYYMDTDKSFHCIINGQTKFDSIAVVLSAVNEVVSSDIADEIITHLIACEYSKNSQMIVIALVSDWGKLEDILQILPKVKFSGPEMKFLRYASVQPATVSCPVENVAKKLFEGCEPINGCQIVD